MIVDETVFYGYVHTWINKQQTLEGKALRQNDSLSAMAVQ